MWSVARQLERIDKKLLIKVEGETCVMQDISKNGMRLMSRVLFKTQTVDINFTMDDIEVELQGQIRWIQKRPTVYDQAQYLVGVYLLDPPEEYIELVEKLSEESDRIN